MASSKPAADRPAKALPADVLAALQAAVQQLQSQRAVADKLGVSTAVVNHLLKDRYVGDVDTMANRIRGAFMASTVRCPVLGDLNRKDCLEHQARPLAFTNPLRPRLFAACKTCPNRKEASHA